MSSPSDTIRRACCACRGFLFAWFLFFYKWCDSTFKSQPPWKSWLATRDGAPFTQGIGGLWPQAPAPLPRRGSAGPPPGAALLAHFLPSPRGFESLAPPLPALLAFFAPTPSLESPPPPIPGAASRLHWAAEFVRLANPATAALPSRSSQAGCSLPDLSGQGHLGDTQHLSCATTWQAEGGGRRVMLSLPRVASKNFATRVILFRSPSPALDTNNPPSPSCLAWQT